MYQRHITSPFVRDLPHSAKELTVGWIPRVKKEVTWGRALVPDEQDESDRTAGVHGAAGLNSSSDSEMHAADGVSTSAEKTQFLADTTRNNYWAIVTTGAGLFSDGYINNSISTVNACLSQIYGKQYSASNAIQNVSSIAFAGTVVGQLSFGYISDYHSRKVAMIVGTSILILFSILAAGAWGVGTTGTQAGGLFAAITAYRFFLGIGIGSEYPAGSTAAAEASNSLPAGKRNRWFCWFTNFMIDAGFVVSSVVPLILLRICGDNHLQPVWRITIGLGAIPPISLFFLRLRYKESKQFENTRFNRTMPYWRIFKFYWFRLLIVSLIWFQYDLIAYSFSSLSSLILDGILGDNATLTKTFGWNIVFNLFYIPGAFLGAIFADYWGPRVTLVSGVLAQAIIGFIMAGCFEHLKKHIAAFTVVFGIFTALGEFSVGDNIGLLASKTCATPIRGQYYGIAAAVGKIGAFVGTYIFPAIIKKYGGYGELKVPFWIVSAICCFSAFLALFFLPPLDQDANIMEDQLFLEYLESTGFDLAQLGTLSSDSDVERVTIQDIPKGELPHED
ncbi:KLTH0G03828p [Lachancea thermotolerans CBS 6340]|uniref:KLTH0G03828p n=1 Tax=Lachancea thermotolerans (strain ATCC 56472 / CBS 6340 / NRRL Y-8284) TaxID=559295 RepID=C5DLV4_LACTC|nr:KLTH0G03828p [Lachancea thermotolerans CBS 6340]CAR24765.1 KLTH0G03828p [Lachancea thermotolerans CBS 6340]